MIGQAVFAIETRSEVLQSRDVDHVAVRLEILARVNVTGFELIKSMPSFVSPCAGKGFTEETS
ncbi:MAG: hypothetical protein ACREOO_15180 [bacterium]